LLLCLFTFLCIADAQHSTDPLTEAEFNYLKCVRDCERWGMRGDTCTMKCRYQKKRAVADLAASEASESVEGSSRTRRNAEQSERALQYTELHVTYCSR
ncbi:hypothetical protein PFISCL1PPCAC_8733, partial [Pristionchus fissidentatus]